MRWHMKYIDYILKIPRVVAVVHFRCIYLYYSCYFTFTIWKILLCTSTQTICLSDLPPKLNKCHSPLSDCPALLCPHRPDPDMHSYNLYPNHTELLKLLFFIYLSGCAGHSMWLLHCGMQAPEHTGSVVAAQGLRCSAVCDLVPWNRDRTHIPYVECRVLGHQGSPNCTGIYLSFQYTRILQNFMVLLCPLPTYLPFHPSSLLQTQLRFHLLESPCLSDLRLTHSMIPA